jgi:hypothetical protein
MTNPSTTALATRSQANLRTHAPLIVNGLTGASIIALLAVGSVVGPVAATGVTAATIFAWLGGLGSNALATWLNEWAMRHVTLFDGDDPDQEWHLLQTLAQDLQAAMGQNAAVASDVALLLDQNDALALTIGELKGQGTQQAKLLQTLLEDLQRATFQNDKLHAYTVRSLKESTAQLLAAQAQGDGVLAAQLREILTAVKTISATPTTSQTINNQASNQGAQGTFHGPLTFNQGSTTIGGNVGSYQKIDVSGGHVGSIIGSQHTYGTSAPAPSAPPTQDDIDDAAEALDLKRRELANANRRAARGVSEAAPQVAQARSEIRRLKAQLRGWGQTVVDAPGDEE